MASAKLLPFRGSSHPELVTGHLYTASHYAKVSGLSASTMATRLYNVYEVYESHLRPVNKNYDDEGKRIIRGGSTKGAGIKSAFTTPTEKFSGRWLNTRIV